MRFPFVRSPSSRSATAALAADDGDDDNPDASESDPSSPMPPPMPAMPPPMPPPKATRPPRTSRRRPPVSRQCREFALSLLVILAFVAAIVATMMLTNRSRHPDMFAPANKGDPVQGAAASDDEGGEDPDDLEGGGIVNGTIGNGTGAPTPTTVPTSNSTTGDGGGIAPGANDTEAIHNGNGTGADNGTIESSTKSPTPGPTVAGDGTGAPTTASTPGELGDTCGLYGPICRFHAQCAAGGGACSMCNAATFRCYDPSPPPGAGVGSGTKTDAPTAADPDPATTAAPTIGGGVVVTPAPVVAADVTAAPTIAEEATTPAPVVAGVTTPAPIASAAVTTPAPVVVGSATKSPTTPLSTGSPTTPLPTVDDGADLFFPATTPAPVAAATVPPATPAGDAIPGGKFWDEADEPIVSKILSISGPDATSGIPGISPRRDALEWLLDRQNHPGPIDLVQRYATYLLYRTLHGTGDWDVVDVDAGGPPVMQGRQAPAGGADAFAARVPGAAGAGAAPRESTKRECEWTGVTCNYGGQVVGIDLSGRALGGAGTVPGEIAELPVLGSLNLSNTGLAGPIPHAIWTAVSLKHLDLSSNHLTSALSPSIGSLSLLETLNLSHNSITSLPTAGLDGAILKQLRTFDASHNKIRGRIPKPMMALPRIRVIDLSHNDAIRGGIPDRMYDSDTAKSLRELRLTNCGMTGPLPGRMAEMTKLEVLMLGGNGFTGEIPGGWGGEGTGLAGNLRELGLEDNDLVGAVPEELATLSGLETLLLYGNGFSGEMPPGLCSLLGDGGGSPEKTLWADCAEFDDNCTCCTKCN